MLVRQEVSGLHLYDRSNGLHCLLDEVQVPTAAALACGPRHLSVALTKRCNLACHYCYSNNNGEDMPDDLFAAVCRAAETGQVLDLTLGGGEPTMHPRFSELVRAAWTGSQFGISVTTNAMHLQPLLEVAAFVSSIRVSVDPYTRQFRGVLERNALRVAEVSRLGVNLLYHPTQGAWAEVTIAALASCGIRDILFLPEHDMGEFKFNAAAWDRLSELVEVAKVAGCAVKVTDAATRFMADPFLPTSHGEEFLFAHIDQRGGICRRSWNAPVAQATDSESVLAALRSLHPLRGSHENLV